MEEFYADVTEYITNEDDLFYDGNFYYNDKLYAIVTPFEAKLDGYGFGNYAYFDILETETDDLIPEDSTPVKIKSGNAYILMLDDTGKLSMLAQGSSSPINIPDEIFNLDNISTFDVCGNRGAVLTDDNQVLKWGFNSFSIPNNDSTIKDIVVGGDRTESGKFLVLYNNGDVFFKDEGDKNFTKQGNRIPEKALDGEYGPLGSDDEVITPNELSGINEIFGGKNIFSAITNNGRPITWGNTKVNYGESYREPYWGMEVKKFAIGNDFVVAMDVNGKVQAWGDDEDVIDGIPVDNVKDIFAINNTSVARSMDDSTIIWGENIEYQGRLSSLSYLFSLTSYSDFIFAVTRQENPENDPVRIPFKLKKDEDDDTFNLVLFEKFDFNPVNFKLDIYYKISETTVPTLDDCYTFALKDMYVQENGLVDYSKVIITPSDCNMNQVIDFPLSFEKVVGEDDVVVLESYTNLDNEVITRASKKINMLSETYYLEEDKIYYADVNRSYKTNEQEPSTILYNKGTFYKGLPDINNVAQNRAEVLENGYDEVSGTQYYVNNGRMFTCCDPLLFQWNHYASEDSERIDPSISNIMDMYVLTKEYYSTIQRWLKNKGTIEEFPKVPTSEDIRNNINVIEKNKSTSDQIMYMPAEFKLLFGNTARREFQARFKVIKLEGSTLTDNEIKSEIINAVNEFFELGNWDFGETLYFTELSTYIHQQLAGNIGSVLIVPEDERSSFGDLFQIKCGPNELFLSTATVNNIEIVKTYTNYNLRRK